MNKFSNNCFPISALALSLAASQVSAGEITSFVDDSGGGVLTVDATEGVVAPGVSIVTGQTNNDDFTSANHFSAKGVVNCLRASVPGGSCDDNPHSGKRTKLTLTGRSPLDLTFQTSNTGGTTEYFSYTKLSNDTGARLVGYQMLVGTGTGSDFVKAEALDPVLFDNTVDNSTEDKVTNWAPADASVAQDPLQRTFYSAGLFGKEAKDTNGDGTDDMLAVGFFSATERTGLEFTADGVATLNAGAATTFDPDTGTTSTFFDSIFGSDTAVVSFSQGTDGIYWDNDDNPDTDGVLMATYMDINGDGTMEWFTNRELTIDPVTNEVTFVEQDADLVDDGIDNDTIVSPNLVVDNDVQVILTDAQVEAILAQSKYEKDVLEDLGKVNLNFSLDVADYAGLDGGIFTLRIAPVFAPIVAAANTDLQFKIAASIDSSNIAYLGQYVPVAVPAVSAYSIQALSPSVTSVNQYDDLIDAIETSGNISQSLERVGYSFLGAYSESALALVRSQRSSINQRANAAASGAIIDNMAFSSDGEDIGAEGVEEVASRLATSNAGGLRHSGNGIGIFVDGTAGKGEYDSTTNSVGYDLEDYTLSAGVDFRLRNDVVLGVALGYGDSEADIDDNRGSLDTAAKGVMFYAAKQFQQKAYLNAMVGAYSLDYDSERKVIIGDTINETYKASTDGTQYVAGLSGGMNYDVGGWSMGPIASAYWVKTDVDGFTETGGDPIVAVSTDDFSVETTWVSLGGQASKQIKMSNGNFIPHAKLSIVKENSDSLDVSTAFGTMRAFDTPVDARDSEYADLELGFAYQINRGKASQTTVGFDYSGLFADTYDSSRVQLSVNVQF
ncbi:choice-of-anchor F family protein [Amphritea opalescens]|uniref:choice-of-anchor F family protein n=1 Tax=Amphritea opalescens TaxID=2490544 RepID=UPI0013E009F8|nr:choice-of-anchor F family protein [Amphritea opalescens]